MTDSALKQAREYFDESDSVSSVNRLEAEEDIRFARLADQWPAKVRAQRLAEGRPCITVNKLAPLIRQIVNEARKNTPSIRVSPVDSQADVETAKVIDGLMRSIQNGKRKADIAYDTALEHAASGGFGFIRTGLDYVSPDSFDMELFVDRVPNPLMVHWDVSSTEFDSSDWNYAFVSDFLTKEEFKRRYPKGDMSSWDGNSQGVTGNDGWLDNDRIRLAEYFERTEHKRTLYQFSDGKVMRADAIPELVKKAAEEGGLDLGGQLKDDEIIGAYLSMTGQEITRTREAAYHTVTRRIINSNEVLEESEWPGSVIPISPVWGDEVMVDGCRHFRSMIRDARDPQMMFNFWKSASTESVAQSTKTPWLVAEGSIPKGAEKKWATSNTQTWPFLPYNANAGPMPTKVPFAGVPAGSLQEALNSSDDIKTVTGIYDSSTGAQSNETSGKAILARERQSNTSNYHLLDNLNRAIEATGKLLVELIPAVYSERQTIRILGEDMKEEVINLSNEAGGSDNIGEDGKRDLYNLSVGQYDVKVEAGTDYATSREEMRETLIEIMRSVPGSAQLIGDLLAENLDMVGADRLSERLKMMLPPQIQQAEGITQQQPQIPGQVPGQPGTAPQLVGQPGQ
ncbi:MAG: hypothetical protein KUG81_03470 [Gammaproteobacteria bacterium]|nr:hypothetical protein [Gammaproteobacteria bacterium]